MTKKRKVRQLSLFRHGGRRKGAGRKPKGKRPKLPRDTRPTLKKRFPVHVTLRLKRGLPSLRREREFGLLKNAFAASGWRPKFQVVHYSVQHDHLHLICEAFDEDALARGVQGLEVRIARRLNRLWGRRGAVFEDRYHAHVLKTPLETYNTLLYVLANARKHGHRYRGLDPFSSASSFPGWNGLPARAPVAGDVVPRTWLLIEGWKKHGYLDPEGVPGPLAQQASSSRVVVRDRRRPSERSGGPLAQQASSARLPGKGQDESSERSLAQQASFARLPGKGQDESSERRGGRITSPPKLCGIKFRPKANSGARPSRFGEQQPRKTPRRPTQIPVVTVSTA